MDFPPQEVFLNMTEYIASVPHTVYTVVTKFTIQNYSVGLLRNFVLCFFNIIPHTLLAIRTVGELMW